MKTIFFITSFLMVALLGAIVLGTYQQNQIERVCGDTHNVALCQLGLMAGHSEQQAHDEGNV